VTISEDDAREAILSTAQELKAEAPRAFQECARQINRHLNDKMKDDDLDVEVHKWFDALDLTDVSVIQRVFPGKELLPKVLQKISSKDKTITRGHCVAALKPEYVLAEILALLKNVSQADAPSDEFALTPEQEVALASAGNLVEVKVVPTK
jgi:hypothetical protein